MARNFRLWENAQCVQLLPPQASSATLAITSPFINIKYGHKVYIECDVNQGNAAKVTFTPMQATGLASASAALTAGSSTTTLTFAAVPAAVTVGMSVLDVTTPAAIPGGTTVAAIPSGTTVTLSVAATGALSGDQILFYGGLNAKALTNPAPVAVILNTNMNDQFVFPGPVTSYQTDAPLGPKTVIFEVDPVESMDTNNLAALNAVYGVNLAFKYLGVQVSASNAANIVACRAKVILARDQRQNPPTVFQ